MAVTAKSRTSKNIGTTPTLVGGYTAPSATQTVVIGLSITNLKNVAVACNVYFANTTANTMLGVNVPIPAGSVFVPVGGDQKIVLQTGYGIRVSGNTALGLDAVMSFVEKT